MTAQTLAPQAPVALVNVKPVNLTNKPEARAAAKALAEARKAKTAADKAIKEASAILDEFMGDANEGIVLGQTVVTRSSVRTNRSTDYSALLEGFPEAYDATVKTSQSTHWLVK